MNGPAGSAGIFAISIALIVYHTDAVKNVTLNDYMCNSKIYNLEYRTPWSIEWKGQKLPNYCRVGVRAKVVSVTICFTIEKYLLDTCGFLLGIYSEYGGDPLKIYSCSALRRKIKFCKHGYKLLYLQITSNYTRLASYTPEVRIAVYIDAGDTTGKFPDGSSTADILGVIFGSLFFFTIATCPVLLRVGFSRVCDTLCSICNSISHCCDCLSCDKEEDEEEEPDPSLQYRETVVTREPGVYTVANPSDAVSLGSLESLEESRSMLCFNELDPPTFPPSSYVDNSCNSSASVSLSNVDNEMDSYIAPPPNASSAALLPDVPPPSYNECQHNTKYV
ncbi:uncharacterized protein LOC117330923 [Pecten maximus]|uniref:uncharacterized protein LOC117330923 n=1 Tax=Pecten maximus TaxID=6579 RepID=UPI0014586288|nr:uncharacterized protein LOC117330923 [Pecten maximus]